MAVSFAQDIRPIFAQYKEPMMWRFDLTNYEAVKNNAQQISEYISLGYMPPPNFPPLTKEFLATYKQWMTEGCPA